MIFFSLSAHKRIFISLFIFFLASNALVFTSLAQNERPEFDEKYGKILAGIIEKQIGLYEETQLEMLVDTIGQKLVSHIISPNFSYRFKILDLQDPNAFSLPGGYIYVTRGLLAISNSEDELAGVIGHEIIHSQNRHSYHQMKTNVLSGILQLPANIAGSYLGSDIGNVINAPFSIGSSLLMSGYSKKNEKEADLEGIWLAAESGYDPLALNDILKSIKTTTEFKTGKEEKKDYFSNHPYTPKRLEYIRSNALELNFSEHRPIFEHDNFLCLLDGLTVGENPTKGILVENLYLHPEKRISLTFPIDWDISNISKAVLGMSKDEEALVLLSLNTEKKSPEKAGKEFLSMVHSKDVEILNSKSLKINGLPAYLITLQTLIDDRMMFFQNLWIEIDSVTYNLIGTGTEKYLKELKATGLSFSRMNDSELTKVKIDVLQIVEALEGENLDDLTKRINTSMDTKYLEIINSIDKKERLKNGQKIKVVIKRNYFDK